MDKPIRVYMGIPSTGSRYDLQTYALRDLAKKYAGRVELVYPEQCVYRIFHDFARNAYCEDFLKSDCDVMWFLDSDIAPPPDTLDLITEHWEKWQLAGAPYPVFMCPPGQKDHALVFTAYHKGEHGYFPTNIPLEGQDFVDGLATGCLFIKREVLERMAKPYFAFQYRDEDRHMSMGEDMYFMDRANALGYKFFVDYGMVCSHLKSVDLLQINNYAMQMAKKYAEQLLLAYQEALREKVAQRKLGLSRPKPGLILP